MDEVLMIETGGPAATRLDATTSGEDLEAVERLLDAVADMLLSTDRGLVGHLIHARGKRVRPQLTLLAARAIDGEASTDAVYGAAAAVELLHIATLYHDDVLDDADRRRGVASVNRLWGNEPAVLGGDALLAGVFGLAASLSGTTVRRLASTLAIVCDGQIRESQSTQGWSRTTEHYFSSIQAKTAALLATACWLGGHCAGASEPQLDALDAFGSNVGVAFQIVDDLLDLLGDPSVIGKPVGSDLRAGVMTLPVINLMATNPELAARPGEQLSDRAISRLCQSVRKSGEAQACAELARAHIDEARNALNTAFPSSSTETLVALATSTLAPLDKVDLDRGGRP